MDDLLLAFGSLFAALAFGCWFAVILVLATPENPDDNPRKGFGPLAGVGLLLDGILLLFEIISCFFALFSVAENAPDRVNEVKSKWENNESLRMSLYIALGSTFASICMFIAI